MPEQTISVHIHAPRETCFAIATDPAMTPRWAGGAILREARHGPLAVGAVYENFRLEAGREVSARYDLTVCDAPHTFTLQKQGSDYLCQYTFEPDSDGTRLTYFESGSELDTISPAMFDTLKQLCETA